MIGNNSDLVGKALTTGVKRAMLQAIAHGYIDEYSASILSDFFAPDENIISVEIIDHRLFLPDISDEEFNQAIANAKAARKKE